MAFQVSVDSHVNTPIARSSRTPEAALQPKPDHAIVKTPSQPIDTIKLSLSAHIHQLKSQGQSAKQIATNLGVDAKTVNTYLNVTATKAAVAPAPAAAPEEKSASASAPLPIASTNQTSASK